MRQTPSVPPLHWAGTVAAFPETEAKEIRRNKIGNVELAD